MLRLKRRGTWDFDGLSTPLPNPPGRMPAFTAAIRIVPRSAVRYNAAPMTLPPWLYPLLFLTGLVAGFVDSIAGGAG
jgi:hypothetical protein